MGTHIPCILKQFSTMCMSIRNKIELKYEMHGCNERKIMHMLVMREK